MLISLDFLSDTPIYQQIRDQIVEGIAKGELKQGDPLPSVRTLSSECGINATTVNKAYQLLKQEGYVAVNRRQGTFVHLSSQESAPDIKTVQALRLSLMELIAQGMSEQEILTLCTKLLASHTSKRSQS
ncbi:MAG: GntR family transcriptional regulator [Atopobiaceae bacterium]|jgi:GntR family transcriptional regulator